MTVSGEIDFPYSHPNGSFAKILQPVEEKVVASSSYRIRLLTTTIKTRTGIRETLSMAYVIAEPCIGTKDTACVDACPVDCIHPKKDEPAYAEEELLYIDPVECIDCGACVPVCPVSAIFALDDLPEKWKAFTERNAAYYGRTTA
jgi:NAD-dependent dihydropyrimidine dehydrogenase PreA subunit